MSLNISYDELSALVIDFNANYRTEFVQAENVVAGKAVGVETLKFLVQWQSELQKGLSIAQNYRQLLFELYQIHDPSKIPSIFQIESGREQHEYISECKVYKVRPRNVQMLIASENPMSPRSGRWVDGNVSKRLPGLQEDQTDTYENDSDGVNKSDLKARIQEICGMSEYGVHVCTADIGVSGLGFQVNPGDGDGQLTVGRVFGNSKFRGKVPEGSKIISLNGKKYLSLMDAASISGTVTIEFAPDRENLNYAQASLVLRTFGLVSKDVQIAEAKNQMQAIFEELDPENIGKVTMDLIVSKVSQFLRKPGLKRDPVRAVPKSFGPKSVKRDPGKSSNKSTPRSDMQGGEDEEEIKEPEEVEDNSFAVGSVIHRLSPRAVYTSPLDRKLSTSQRYIKKVIETICLVNNNEPLQELSYGQIMSVLQSFGALENRSDMDETQAELLKVYELLDPLHSGSVPILVVIKLVEKFNAKRNTLKDNPNQKIDLMQLLSNAKDFGVITPRKPREWSFPVGNRRRSTVTRFSNFDLKGNMDKEHQQKVGIAFIDPAHKVMWLKPGGYQVREVATVRSVCSITPDVLGKIPKNALLDILTVCEVDSKGEKPHVFGELFQGGFVQLTDGETKTIFCEPYESLGTPFPVSSKFHGWVEDKECWNCCVCYSQFNLFWTKRRCFRCGLVICETCECDYQNSKICRCCQDKVSRTGDEDEVTEMEEYSDMSMSSTYGFTDFSATDLAQDIIQKIIKHQKRVNLMKRAMRKKSNNMTLGVIGAQGSGKHEFLKLMFNIHTLHRLCTISHTSTMGQMIKQCSWTDLHSQEEMGDELNFDTKTYRVDFKKSSFILADTPDYSANLLQCSRKQVDLVIAALTENVHLDGLIVVLDGQKDIDDCASTRFVLSQILTFFPTEFVQNIYFVLTNAQNKETVRIDIEELQEDLGWKREFVKRQIYYTLNPMTCLQKIQGDLENGIVCEEDPSFFWYNAHESFSQFTKFLCRVAEQPRLKMREVSELLEERESLLNQVCNVKESLDDLYLWEHRLSDEKRSLEAIWTGAEESKAKLEEMDEMEWYLSKALVKRTYTTVCAVEGVHTNCHVGCKCIPFTDKPGSDAFLQCECAILSSETCMVCGHKLTEHYHVWGKGWKRRVNKEYNRLKDSVENCGANASISKQRIEEYKKRVEESRMVFDEQQKELTERIEILQNTVIAVNYIESAFILEYRLLLEASDDERFPSGRRKAELEKTIESCGFKAELQRLNDASFRLNEPEFRPVVNQQNDAEDLWAEDETQDNSLNLFDLMSKQKQVIQSLSVDSQVDRALQEARDFLSESATTRKDDNFQASNRMAVAELEKEIGSLLNMVGADNKPTTTTQENTPPAPAPVPKKHTRRRAVSDVILSRSRAKKRQTAETTDGWRKQLIAGVMKGLNRRDFEPSRSRSASPPLRDLNPGVVSPKLNVANPGLKEDETQSFELDEDESSSDLITLEPRIEHTTSPHVVKTEMLPITGV